MKLLAVLCFGVLAISAADLVPVAGPRTELFLVDPYFEEGSGLSIAEVEVAGNKSRLLRVNRVDGTAMTLFPVVLNQDGSVNSAENPAEKGSIVVLWGTSGGNSLPASFSGEITPSPADRSMARSASRVRAFQLTKYSTPALPQEQSPA